MKIELIVTCVGRTSLNMLCHTIGFNSVAFHNDNVIIVTTESDKDTQNFCVRRNLNCFPTDLFFKNGARFNRGAALTEVFKNLKFNDWVLHLDADILLPNGWRTVFKQLNPDKEFMYGSRRIILPKYRDYLDLSYGKKVEEFWTPRGIAYGFLQLFNYQSEVFKNDPTYPESYDSAESDWKFRNRWGETVNGDREYTGKLRELPFFVEHFGDPGEKGAENFVKSCIPPY